MSLGSPRLRHLVMIAWTIALLASWRVNAAVGSILANAFE
jgi:hypothetical protein